MKVAVIGVGAMGLAMAGHIRQADHDVVVTDIDADKRVQAEANGLEAAERTGLKAILLASAVGLIIPAGPVIAFSVAAIFARSDASTAALIAFITSWSLFAAHRIFIYEIPLLGPSFLRLRLVSVAVTPVLAGLMALAWAGLAGGK